MVVELNSNSFLRRASNEFTVADNQLSRDHLIGKSEAPGKTMSLTPIRQSRTLRPPGRAHLVGRESTELAECGAEGGVFVLPLATIADDALVENAHFHLCPAAARLQTFRKRIGPTVIFVLGGAVTVCGDDPTTTNRRSVRRR